MLKKTLLTLLLVAFSAEAYGTFRFLVLHSQTDVDPLCPTNWAQLWKGYSYAGTWLSSGLGSPQDLGQPGSCLEAFVPLQGIRCNRDNCDYDVGVNISLYLLNKNDVTENSINTDSKANLDKIEKRISRCIVCQGAKPILVKHGLKGVAPDCPSGWSSLWTGHSVAMTSREAGRDGSQNLSDTGSCLPHWVPTPVYHCQRDKCTYASVDQDTLWLLNHDTVSDTASRTPANAAANLGRIGRCNVCVRD